MSIHLRGLDPSIREAAQWTLDVASMYDVPVTVTSTVRSWAEQQKLYDAYRYKKDRGIPAAFPAAQPGYSAHQYGLAWDSHVPPEFGQWWKYVREYAGFQVPGNDVIHAQYPNWKSLYSWT